jgi:hypothetical protein
MASKGPATATICAGESPICPMICLLWEVFARSMNNKGQNFAFFAPLEFSGLNPVCPGVSLRYRRFNDQLAGD